MKILLDYLFKITAINPTPAASTAALKQVCLVAKPKSGQEGNVGEIFECVSTAEVAARTDNENADQLFAAGMTKVFVLLANDLDLTDALEGHLADFKTILISDDFVAADIIPSKASGGFTITSYANLVSGTPDVISVAGQAFTAQSGAATPGDATFRAATSNNDTAASLAAQINAHAATKDKVLATVVGAVVTVTAKDEGSSSNAIALGYTDNDTNVGATKTGTTLTGGDGLFAGAFNGVIALSSDDDDFLEDQAVIQNRVAFHAAADTGADNLAFAIGKLLSNALDWKNQQYIQMPFDDDVDTLGEADSLFDKKISFVISDDEYGPRLALFAAGGEAIVAPYIRANLEIDLQSKALQYMTAVQPAYTNTNAALLEDELQKVIDGDGEENGNPGYVGRGWLTKGKVEVNLVADDFVAGADVDIAKPRAMWRIFGNLSQTL